MGQTGLLPTEPEPEAPEEFITWLQNELRKRGWPVELAVQYAGISPYFIERILQEKKRPSFEIACRLARAFACTKQYPCFTDPPVYSSNRLSVPVGAENFN